jgi:hypothetical protein
MTGWDERISLLEAEFPGWHIWLSNAGRWWATRTGLVRHRDDLGAGRVMTVDGDDEAALREQLAVQAALDQGLGGLTGCAKRSRALEVPCGPFAADEHTGQPGQRLRVLDRTRSDNAEDDRVR